jgi:hypothetical protein
MADRTDEKNFLFTFAHDGARKCAAYFAEQKRSDLRLLIDSGAFTAWKQSRPVNLKDYIAFAQELQGKAHCAVEFIGLDVIAGTFAERKTGNPPSSEETAEACRQGFANYLEMEAAGVPCIPTYHRDDPWVWLDRIAERAERFCLAPRVDGSPKSVKMSWLNDCFRRLGPSAWKKHRIHGLGVASLEIMETYPFYSVDSTALQVGQRGCSYRYFDGYRAPIVSKDDWSYRVWEAQLAHDNIGDPSAIDAIQHYREPGQGSKDGQLGTYWYIEQAMLADVQSERYITEHWEHRGVTWHEVKNGDVEDFQPGISPVAIDK